MKKIVIALLAVLLVASCVVGIVACDPKNPENPTPDVNVLDNYIFESNGQVVSEDFVLPGTIGEKEVTWASDNSAITVTLSDVDGNWQAVVTAPETEIATVTLTVSQGTYTKSFTVQVAPIVVGDIADAYEFAQERATLTADFSLETSTTYKGKTATIAWTVSEDYAKYINVSTGEDGKVTCKVNPQTSITDVQITATFTFGTTTAVRNYRMSVYRPMEAIELVDYWYNNTGVSIDMSGWVVGIATAYSESYGNISLYMVNDDLTAGYYLYRVKADAATGAALKPGVHVTATGTTNTNYNGIIETNAGGTIKIDKEETIELSKVVKALDDELIGNVPALIYNESRLVSLTNWKVSKVASEPKQASPGTILTLEKEGVKVTVATSKYMEGSYIATATKDVYTDEYTALFNKLAGIKEGSYVSVTGIFSYYSGWQILPRSADDVTVGEADAEGTKYVGTSLKAAIKEVTDTLNDAGLNKRVTKEVSTNLPTSVDGVTISYTKVGGNALTLAPNGDKVQISVVPGDPDESIFKVTYTVGEYSTVDFIQVTSLIPTAATMMDDLAELMPTEIKVVTDLPTLDGVDIKWDVKEGSEANIAIDNGQLVPTLAADPVNVFVKATFTYKEVKTYRFFKITVAAGKGAKAIDMTKVAEDAEYVLAVNQVTMGKTLYVLGSLDSKGQFLNTTSDPEKAEKIYAEIVKDAEDETKVLGYRLYFKAKDGSKTYIATQVAENAKGVTTGYMALVKENAPVWTYDAETNSLYTTVDLGEKEPVKHYFGSYSSTTYETLSLSKSSYISKTNTGVSQFPAFLATIEFEQLADNKITVKATNATVENLSKESGKNGTKFTFTVTVADNCKLDSVKVNGTAVEADNGVYTGVVDGPTTVTVTALPDVTPYVSIKEALTIAGALEDGATSAQEYLFIGKISEITTPYDSGYKNVSFNISDGNGNSILVFRYSLSDASTVKVGDVVCFIGQLKKYGETLEVVKNFKEADVTSIADASAAGLAGTGVAGTRVFGMISAITTPYDSGYNNITVTLTDGTNSISIFRLKGGEELAVGDYLLVTGTPSSFKESAQFAQGATYDLCIKHADATDPDAGTDTPVDPTPSETLDTPEKIVNAAYALEKGASLDGTYTLTGKIISVDEAYGSFKNITVTIVVGDLTDKPIKCFRMTGTGADVIAVNDTITVTGTLTNYNGTIEFAQGCTLGSYTLGTSTISVGASSSDKATVSIKDNKTSGANGSEFTFTVTVNDGYEIVSVTVNGAEVTASNGVYTAKISGNTTILVETKEEGAATATVVATAKFGKDYNNKFVNNYSDAWTATVDGVVFNMSSVNNGEEKNDWSAVRIGHKKNAGTASIATDAAMANAITKIVINFTQVPSDMSWVNSAKLLVSANADFSEATEINFTIAKGEVTIVLDKPVANAYYKIVVDYKAAGDSIGNGAIRFDKIDFYAVPSETAEA